MNTLLPSFTAGILQPWLPGSLAILVVLALGPAVRRLLGARAAHLLWLLVILRFLVPNIPVLPWSYHAVPPSTWIVPDPAQAVTTVDIKFGPRREIVPPLPAIPWLELLWAAGATTFLAASFTQAWQARRLTRGAADIRGRADILQALRSLPAVPSFLRICETDQLRSPALCGVFRPVIFLPVGWSKRLTPEELRCVLAHEIGHFRRGDILWRWAFLLVRALHWFNPLVWLAERAARCDQELACDEWVMQNARPSSLEEYGEVLLKAAQISARRLAVSAPMAESHRGLSRRIHHLAAFRPHGWTAQLATIVATGLLALLIGPAQSQDGSSQAAPANHPSAPAESPRVAASSGPRTPPPGADAPEPPNQVEIESKFVEFVSQGQPTVFDDRPGQWTILRPDESQKLLRDLENSKADLLGAPKVAVPSGQRATVQIVREFRYPTEYKTANQRVTPSNFEIKNVGVTLEVTPSVDANRKITLVLTPRIVEFEGFINYGSGISNPRPPGTDTVSAVTGGEAEPGDETIMQPVFAVRSLTGNVTLREGESAVLGGLSRTDLQTVSDTVKGRQIATTQPVHRKLYLLVTPRLLHAGPPNNSP